MSIVSVPDPISPAPNYVTAETRFNLCLLRMRSSHAIAFYHSSVIVVAFEVLNESLSRPLGGIPTNLYLSVSTITVPSWRRGFLSRRAWLPFLTCWICILRTLLSGLSFLFRIYANCGVIAVIASTTYMTVMNTPPPSPLRWQSWMIIVDHNTNIYIEWHNKYYQWKQKEAPKLAVKGNRFWSRSIITTILLPFLAWWLNFCAAVLNFCAAVFLWKLGATQ